MYRLKTWIEELRTEIKNNKELLERSTNEINERLGTLINEADGIDKRLGVLESHMRKSKNVKSRGKNKKS